MGAVTAAAAAAAAAVPVVTTTTSAVVNPKDMKKFVSGFVATNPSTPIRASGSIARMKTDALWNENYKKFLKFVDEKTSSSGGVVAVPPPPPTTTTSNTTTAKKEQPKKNEEQPTKEEKMKTDALWNENYKKFLKFVDEK